MSEFISQLIMEHQARVSHKPTRVEIAAELRRLADLRISIDAKSE